MRQLRTALIVVCAVVVGAFWTAFATLIYLREGNSAQSGRTAAAAPVRTWSFGDLLPWSKPPAGGDLVAVARKVRPAVVLVQSLDEKGVVQSTGTGFFISADGKFVTNAHVVDGGTAFRIRCDNGTTTSVKGTLVFQRETDLAVLQADCTGMPFLTLERDLPAEPGEKVVVIGSPLGLEGTVSDGIVSATRSVDGGDQFIQITAPLSPGSSGSPVVDLQGRLIGVATLASFGRAQALNFAVAEKHVRVAVELSGRTRGYVSTTKGPARAPESTSVGLSVKDIVIRLQAGFSSREVAAEVKQKGTAGAFPPDGLTRIRELGGGEDLLVLCKPPTSSAGLNPYASGTEAERGRAVSGMDSKQMQEQARWHLFRREIEGNLALQSQRIRSALAAESSAPPAKSTSRYVPEYVQTQMREQSIRRLAVLEERIRQMIEDVNRAYANPDSRPDPAAVRRREAEIRALYQEVTGIAAQWR